MDDDQQFCLRWNNHQSTLISVFDTLLEKGIHVDCTLAAEGQTLKAHKVVLSACSPYFESVLSQQYDKHPIIILKDVKFAELRAMMDYMYRGEVNISQDQLAALLKAAESLQIKGLSDSKPPPRTSSPIHKGRLESTASGNINSREGSSSPLPRKRRKPRRSSLTELDNEILNNTDTIPSQNHIINNTAAVLPKLPPTVENSVENDIIAAKVKLNDTSDCTPKIKNDITAEGIDTKEELCEEGTEDSVEDLTLDEEIDSEVEHSGPGPSHPQGDCVQSFAWHMDRAQDESTPSLDGQRESQVPKKYDEALAGILSRTTPLTRGLLRGGIRREKPILRKITRKRKNVLKKTVSILQSIVSKQDTMVIKSNKYELAKTKDDKQSFTSKLTRDEPKITAKNNVTKSKTVISNIEVDKTPETSRNTMSDAKVEKSMDTNQSLISNTKADKSPDTSKITIDNAKIVKTLDVSKNTPSNTRVVKSLNVSKNTPLNTKVIKLLDAEQSLDTIATKIEGIDEKIKDESDATSQDSLKKVLSNLPCAQYATAKGYKCPNCQRTYNARKNLVRHVNLECGREPQHKCLHCSHKTHRRNELKRHIQKKHTTIDSKSG